MTSPPSTDDPLQSVKDVVGDNSLAIAIVGALTSILVAFVPGSPLVGGALAGYLVRDDRERGAVVGTLSGVIASIPTLVGFVFFAVVVVGFAAFGSSEVILLLFVIAFGLFGLLYTIGLGALGGYLGVILYERRTTQIEGIRRTKPAVSSESRPDDSRPDDSRPDESRFDEP